MKFTAKYFDPEARGGNLQSDGRVAFRAGDQPEDLHVYNPKTILALNVALATRRPLLISGEPGSGKSTLARGAAAVLGWRYYKQMITSRTQAADLLWKYDTLRRLSDAQNRKQTLLPNQYYVEPGSLWWAFDPVTATQRGSQTEIALAHRVRDPDLGRNVTTPKNAVVLLDEIDKADPDVPNDLLEPLDLKEFTVRETNDRVRLSDDRDLLMILTTNGEREMPPAVLRRCVLLTLDPPNKEWFVTLADLRRGETDHELHEAVAGAVMDLRKAARKASLREPSTSEFLDALAVCDQLGIDTTSADWKNAKAWQEVRRTVLWKHSMEPKLDDSEDENE
jgi:MoxR-like ATPase